MKLHWMILIVLVLLVGCKPAKQVNQQNTETFSKAQVTSETKTESLETTSIGEVIKESLKESDSLVMQESTIKLSIPDSSGNQHVVEIVNRTISSGKKKEKETITERKKEDTAVKTSEASTDSTGTNQTHSKVVEKTKRTLPAKLIIVLVVVLGLAVWGWSKRGEISQFITRLFINKML